MKMKVLIRLICFLVLQALLVIPPLPLMEASPVSSQTQANDHEQESTIESIINLAKAYRKAGKYEKARQVLEESLKRFLGKENRKKLQIELADVHYRWAVNLKKRYDYANAITHYEKAYAIDKIYRLKDAYMDLAYIAVVYNALGRKQKALEYCEKALPITRTIGDRAGEAALLNNIGMMHSDLGQKQKALEYYEKALPIKRAIGDREGEASTLNSIGRVYSDLGQKQKALEYYKIVLPIVKAIGDKNKEAITLNNIGFKYFVLGQKQKALEYYEKALPITRAIGDHTGEASILDNIGKVHSDLGQKQKALEYYEKALPIRRAIGDREGEAATLNNIGEVYDALSQRQKALEYYGKALPIRRAIGDREGEAATLSNIGLVYDALGHGEATALNNIGVVYDALGQKQKALEYYEKALPINRAIGDREGEATTLNNIGRVYDTFGQKQKALEYFEKALLIMRTDGYRAGEATTLNNIGGVYDELGQKQKALEYYEKALLIKRAIGDRAGEATTLNNIMFYWVSLKNTYLSIYYGKRSVNAFQNLRSFIRGLKKEVQTSYIETKKGTYRDLANLLITAGRISEAQDVMDILKIQEYRDFIRSDTSSFDFTSTQVDFTPFEEQWLREYNTRMDRYSDISNEYHVLKFKKNKNDAEKKRMEELDWELKKKTKAYEEYLAQLKGAFNKHEKEIKEGKPDSNVIAKEVVSIYETLKYLDGNKKNKNAVLYYLVFDDCITVLITTSSGVVIKQTEIDENELNLMIVNYRNFISKYRKEMRDARQIDTSTETEKQKNPYAKKLYDLIFRPVDEELKKYETTNLMISLDGVLRYIPLGTLWDGENYLVQRYRLTVITPSSLKNIKTPPVQKKKILGMGASQGGQGFKRLPHVRKEIQAIVNDKEKGYNGLIQGKAFIDHDFTKDTMLKELEKKDYPLVHISSHFKFSPGDETKNFLLLGDGNVIKLSEIRRMGKLFDNVKLLVLSACQTGVGGNGEEIDGFGELAQQSGAKSVVASLWSVEDKSTKYLMVAFYRIMKERKVTGKIEALRQAQLELAGLEDLLQKNNTQGGRQKSKYSHPYYWGSFIMMGNWR
jgi:CHAT domain-containing protein/Tfp pilus assembly protein PilF